MYSHEVTEVAKQVDLVIAADGGLRHAKMLALKIDLIVGDFDSVQPEDLLSYPNVPQERHPPEKDWLDLELAIAQALEKGATELVLMGVLGDRLDQSLAALLITARQVSTGLPCSIFAGTSTVYWLRGFEQRSFAFAKGKVFSVLSFSPSTTLTLEGAQYPLEDFALDFGLGLGVSNEVSQGPLVVTVHDGLACLIVEHQLQTSREP